MASILYAWEFGAALGHIGTYLPVAQELRSRGHTIHWVVTQPGQAVRLLDDQGFTWLQAPILPERSGNGPPLSYSDILLRFGYGEPSDLLGAVVAWRELLCLTQCKVVMVDHAPSAILAARTLGLPVMHFGGGFFTPPPCDPLPALRDWQATPTEVLKKIDAHVLESINSVLGRFDKPCVNSVASLFDVAETALLTFPELDHYRDRGPSKYWGALPAASARPPQWPAVDHPKVFAYLRPSFPHFDACLKTLAESSFSVLVYAPGISGKEIARWASDSLNFAPEPVDLNLASSQAIASVNYAAAATTMAFLLAGKPVLLLPGHLEQFLLARRVVEMGAGLLMDPQGSPLDLPARLAQIAFDPSFSHAAKAFAAKYSQFDQKSVAHNIARRVEELIAVSSQKG